MVDRSSSVEVLRSQLASSRDENASLKTALIRAHRLISHLSASNPEAYLQVISTLPPQDITPEIAVEEQAANPTKQPTYPTAAPAPLSPAAASSSSPVPPTSSSP